MFQSKIPPTCTLTVGKTPWSFALCVQYIVDTNPEHFNKTMSARRAGDRLVNALVGKAEGDAFEWAEEDRAILVPVFDDPAQGWCPELVRTDEHGDVVLNRDGEPIKIQVSARVFYGYDETISPPKDTTVNGAAAAAKPAPEATASA